MTWPNPQLLGTIDPAGSATPLTVDLGNGLYGGVRIVLTQDYLLHRPVGFPTRPDFTGTNRPDSEVTLTAGTVCNFWKPEAAALITAGAAVAV